MLTFDQIEEYIESLSDSDTPKIAYLTKEEREQILALLSAQGIIRKEHSVNWTAIHGFRQQIESGGKYPFILMQQMILIQFFSEEKVDRILKFIKFLILGPELSTIYKDNYEIEGYEGEVAGFVDFMSFLYSGDPELWKSFVMRLWCGRLNALTSAIDQLNVNEYFAQHIHGGPLVPDQVKPITKGILLPIWQFLISNIHHEFELTTNIKDSYLVNVNLSALLRLLSYYIKRAEVFGNCFVNFSLLIQSVDSNIDQAKMLLLIKSLVEASGHKIHISVPLTESVPILEII